MWREGEKTIIAPDILQPNLHLENFTSNIRAPDCFYTLISVKHLQFEQVLIFLKMIQFGFPVQHCILNIQMELQTVQFPISLF